MNFRSLCILKMFSFGMEMLLPLVSSFVNDVVLHVSEMALQVVHMLDFHLIDSILIYAPDFVVNWV